MTGIPRVSDRRSLASAACLLAALLSCCSRERVRGAGGQEADTLANGLPRALAAPLESWLVSWRRELPGVSPDSLTSQGDRAYAPYVAWQGAGKPTNGVRTRAGIFVVAPDSARALDVDMYLDFEVDRDGRVRVLREPDSTPLIFDFRSDTVWHVEFCGTSCGYEHACWLDSLRFALAGGTETGIDSDPTWQAFVDVYDLRTRRCRRWTSHPIPNEAFGRHVELADSLLGERLEAAGFVPGQGSAPALGMESEE